ncbi:hypothetical protein [Rhodoligotrophos ferricapiens]|uniref:hypothetical protein n=1 Tax=Rhodoligotrophos ferricapiens TaxID=3069264 RepID=UPI00315CE68D
MSSPVARPSQMVENHITDESLEQPGLQKPATGGMVARLKQKFEALSSHPPAIDNHAGGHELNQADHTPQARIGSVHIREYPSQTFPEHSAESLESSSGYGSTASLRSELEAGSAVENLTSTSEHRAHEAPALHQEANDPIESLRQLSDHDFHQTFGPEQKASNPVEILGRMSDTDFERAFGTEDRLGYRVNAIDQVRADLANRDHLFDQFVGSAKVADSETKPLNLLPPKIDYSSQDWREVVSQYIDKLQEVRTDSKEALDRALQRTHPLGADRSDAAHGDLKQTFHELVDRHGKIFDGTAHLLLHEKLPETLSHRLVENLAADTHQYYDHLSQIYEALKGNYDFR